MRNGLDSSRPGSGSVTHFYSGSNSGLYQMLHPRLRLRRKCSGSAVQTPAPATHPWIRGKFRRLRCLFRIQEAHTYPGFASKQNNVHLPLQYRAKLPDCDGSVSASKSLVFIVEIETEASNCFVSGCPTSRTMPAAG